MSGAGEVPDMKASGTRATVETSGPTARTAPTDPTASTDLSTQAPASGGLAMLGSPIDARTCTDGVCDLP
ncbi:MAG: hypothetical protein WCF36_12365 [Candidatus Nanopelagicales bacterium]